MEYPVDLHEDEGSVYVTFPDLPEAITLGDDVEDALRHAVDALETALEFYTDDSRPAINTLTNPNARVH